MYIYSSFFLGCFEDFRARFACGFFYHVFLVGGNKADIRNANKAGLYSVGLVCKYINGLQRNEKNGNEKKNGIEPEHFLFARWSSFMPFGGSGIRK